MPGVTPPAKGIKVLLAGQDITAYCDEKSINLEDTLGQGPGVQGGSSGRATTFKILTSLGPAGAAIGAGQLTTGLQRNLLTRNQSDIEASAAGFNAFVGSGGSMSRDPSQFWQGASSLKVVTDGTGTFQYVNTQINVANNFFAGQTYTASFYILGAAASVGKTLRYFVDSNVGAVSSVNALTLSATWTRYSITFVTPTPITATWFAPRLDTGGTAQTETFWIDGLQFEVGASATTWQEGGPVIPSLVRQGEVQVIDTLGNYIFGGYVTELEDMTVAKTNYTQIDATDYWQDLSRINVTSEVFDGQTDIYIIRYLMAKYAPNISLSLIPASSSFILGPKTFKNKSLQACIQNICDNVGFIAWIDYSKNLHYLAPTAASTAPFALSDTPDYRTSFRCTVETFTVDDTAAINRVTFYGGKRLSNDYIQDLSPQCNGNLTTLTLAYYPHKSSDGKFHAYIGGGEIVLGFYGSVGPKNTLKSQGGLCDVLLNTDAHTLIYDVAPVNGGPNSVTVKYRYESPLVVQVEDSASIAYYGRILDGTIADNNVFDTQTAVQRCRILLLEQSKGLLALTIHCYKPGIMAGMLLRVDHVVRGIHASFLVQKVTFKGGGGGFFDYQIDCGAWNWNLVDLVMTSARQAAPDDESQTESQDIAFVDTMTENLGISLNFTTQTRTMALYYPRSVALGDGHDAYPGLCTI